MPQIPYHLQSDSEPLTPMRVEQDLKVPREKEAISGTRLFVSPAPKKAVSRLGANDNDLPDSNNETREPTKRSSIRSGRGSISLSINRPPVTSGSLSRRGGGSIAAGPGIDPSVGNHGRTGSNSLNMSSAPFAGSSSRRNSVNSDTFARKTHVDNASSKRDDATSPRSRSDTHSRHNSASSAGGSTPRNRAGTHSRRGSVLSDKFAATHVDDTTPGTHSRRDSEEKLDENLPSRKGSDSAYSKFSSTQNYASSNEATTPRNRSGTRSSRNSHFGGTTEGRQSRRSSISAHHRKNSLSMNASVANADAADSHERRPRSRKSSISFNPEPLGPTGSQSRRGSMSQTTSNPPARSKRANSVSLLAAKFEQEAEKQHETTELRRPSLSAAAGASGSSIRSRRGSIFQATKQDDSDDDEEEEARRRSARRRPRTGSVFDAVDISAFVGDGDVDKAITPGARSRSRRESLISDDGDEGSRRGSIFDSSTAPGVRSRRGSSIAPGAGSRRGSVSTRTPISGLYSRKSSFEEVEPLSGAGRGYSAVPPPMMDGDYYDDYRDDGDDDVPIPMEGDFKRRTGSATEKYSALLYHGGDGEYRLPGDDVSTFERMTSVEETLSGDEARRISHDLNQGRGDPAVPPPRRRAYHKSDSMRSTARLHLRPVDSSEGPVAYSSSSDDDGDSRPRNRGVQGRRAPPLSNQTRNSSHSSFGISGGPQSNNSGNSVSPTAASHARSLSIATGRSALNDTRHSRTGSVPARPARRRRDSRTMLEELRSI